MMNQNDSVSGINGRLRPRKSVVSNSERNKRIRNSDHKTADDKKSSKSKPIHTTDNLHITPLEILCPYCDKKFSLKQSLSKHLKRSHNSSQFNHDSVLKCQFCNHTEKNPNHIFKHTVDSHPNQYFACLECQIRFPSTTELAEHKLNFCEKQNIRTYRNKLRRKCNLKSSVTHQKSLGVHDIHDEDDIFPNEFNNVVISCELKPSQVPDTTDIENNITTNVILPPCKNIINSAVIEKNAVIVLDNIQWNKKITPNFSFHTNDSDQILSRLGVVHKSPRIGVSTKREWHRHVEDTKFEKCFDTSFYSKVASNVQENLSKFLDGSSNRLPDADNTIKTRKSKNSVVINTVEGFPTLLTSEQCSRNDFDSYTPRMIAPKHKWKWDNNENEKGSFLNQFQIKGDLHTNNCIINLVSKLDIGTQLCMRHKYEAKFGSPSSITKNTEKVNAVCKELKEILESREIPNLSKAVVKNTNKNATHTDRKDFPASLGLMPVAPPCDIQPTILSGEWVRPRRYICCACGEQTHDSKTLSAHISSQHPMAQVSHSEIVGEPLLNPDILKRLYVPPNQVANRTRPLRGSRECTKCKKPITFDDLHEHMLECAGDTPVVRRKCRYRPFGVRRRRPRLPDNRIRKKMRKDLRNSQKKHMRPRPRIRSEVGDGETIRKMLADLPAKRHRITINPVHTILRPREIHENLRNKLRLKRRPSQDLKNKKTAIIAKNENLSKKETCDDSQLKRSQKIFPKIKESRVQRNLSHKPMPDTKKSTKNNNNVERSQQDKNNAKTKSTTEPSTSIHSVDLSEVTNTDQELSLHSGSNRVDLNSASSNVKECSAREGSSYRRDTWKAGCNDQNRGELSKNSSPQKVPLKHSIERLTSNTDTNDRAVRLQRSFLAKQDYIRSFSQNSHHSLVGHQLLFENEAIVTKLDKPPLLNICHMIDPYAGHKAKLNKPRKGLNDCIAMLKNKLVEPIPSTSTDPHKTDLCKFTTSSKKLDDNVSHVPQEANITKTKENKVILPAHIATNVCAMIPLDLSGKSQRLMDEKDQTNEEATNLCTKGSILGSFAESKETYTTLDLSSKSTKVKTEKLNQITAEKPFLTPKVTEKSQQSVGMTKNVELTLDLSIKPTRESSKSSNTTLDLSDKTSNNTSNLDRPGKTSKTIIDLNAKVIVEVKKPAEKSFTKVNQNRSVEKAVQSKPVYDPTLKIPQYKIRVGGPSELDTKDTDKELMKPPSESCNIDLLPKEIVDIIGTMPPQHRNTLLNVLPQVFAKTVKQLKLVVDSNTNKDTTTLPNKNEIATQTSTSSIEPTCPPEFLNIDTDKYLIDPCTGAITERTQNDKELSEVHISSPNKVIDLTSDERAIKETPGKPEEPPKKDLQESVTVNLTNHFSDHIRPQKPSNDQTASLRAVRIKSSNDKRKCMKLDSKLVNILPNKSLHTPDVTLKIGHDLTDKGSTHQPTVTTMLAIQQSEVSSTQQNSCNNNLSQKTVSTLKPNDKDKKLTNLENDVNDSLIQCKNNVEFHTSQTTKVVNDAQALPIELTLTPTSDSVIESKSDMKDLDKGNVSVTMSIANQPVNVQSDSQSDLSKKLLLEPHDINKTLPEVFHMTDTPVQTLKHKSKSHDINEEVTANQNIPILPQSDDDPDDNLSLALIVKQKQRENIVSHDPPFKSEKLSPKRGKRQKKQSKSSFCQDKSESFQSKNINAINKQNKKLKKKRNKKSKKNVNTDSTLINQHNIDSVSNTISKGNDIHENDVKNDDLQDISVFNTTPYISEKNSNTGEDFESFNEALLSEVEHQPVLIKDVKADLDITCDNDNLWAKNIDKLHDKTQKYKEINNSNKLSVTPTELEVRDSLLDKKGPCKEDLETVNIKRHLRRKRGDNRKMLPNDEKCHKTIDEDPRTETNQIVDVEENIKNTALKTQSFGNIIDNKDNEFNMNVCKDEQEEDKLSLKTFESFDNSLKTLRRSKRGQSLCIENVIVENTEVVLTENFIENKNPMTKKQLIFSKLLLDENGQNSQSIRDECKVIFPVNSNSILLTTSNIQANDKPKEINKFPKVMDKTLKRIKSPHLKQQQSKKKKVCNRSLKLEEENCTINSNYQCNLSKDEQVYGESNQTQDEIVSLLNTPDKYTNTEKKIQILCTPLETILPTSIKEDKVEQSSTENHTSTFIERSNSKEEINAIVFNDNNKILDDLIPVTDSVKVNSEYLLYEKSCNNNLNDLSEETLNEQNLLSENNETCENVLEKRKDTIILSKMPKPKKIKLSAYNVTKINNDSSDISSQTDENDLCDKYKHDPICKKPVRRKTRSKSYKKLCKNDDLPVSHKTPLPEIETETVKTTINKNPDSVFIPDRSHIEQPHTSTHTTPRFKSKHHVAVKNCIHSSINQKDIDDIFNGRDDSDDSTKSDIPLQKYIQDIYKTDNDSNNSVNSGSDRDCNDKEKCSKSTPSKFNNPDIENDTEEQTKSEQFMESFGFFSERKPRKSNLIASKKISETFHVIGSESDDGVVPNRERVSRKVHHHESKKRISQKKDTDDNDDAEDEDDISRLSPQMLMSKKSGKRSRKKKLHNSDMPFCSVCQKEFRRRDNLYRHQLTLLHISKLSKFEMKFDTVPYNERPNYLLTYRKRFEKLKRLTDQLQNEAKLNGTSEIIQLPTFADIMADVHTIAETSTQNVSRRDLSCDEALFLDCCELLKESHKNDSSSTDPSTSTATVTSSQFTSNSFVCTPQPSTSVQDYTGKSDNKSDGDVDSITAKNIMESEEVRNLENDLICGLKEAVSLSGPKHSIDDYEDLIVKDCNEHFHTLKTGKPDDDVPIPLVKYEDCKIVKDKVKKKKILDKVDNIDIFEDKFDKIKRKCRSQAAAAKHLQTALAEKISAKGKKKSGRRSKRKKGSKKNLPNTVLTKGALKGFDGIKVSIPTSDINISAIVPSLSDQPSAKRRKKNYAKKREEKKRMSQLGNPHYMPEHNSNDMRTQPKKIDVYEFKDNEDTDMFDFRTSSLLERFKSPNKDTPSTSKAYLSLTKHVEDSQVSSASASDGDDFVYMSDDYLCSADETENSLMSCEIGNGAKIVTDNKKPVTNNKRKEAVEKSTAMGKIFKNNAMRNERKDSSNTTESTAATANLDQLFDSLLENEPNTSQPTSSNNAEDDILNINSNIIGNMSDNETGVARHRARRKCTVGKQNVLAETWSSESEPDIVSTARPNSAESIATVAGRKRKSKKNTNQHGIRRNRHISFKVDDSESRVTNSDNAKGGRKDKRSRSDMSYHWSSADEEGSGQGEPHALVEQHGWIVGDSHKKLVTMLAHAKGRKRDDRRTFVE